MFELHDAKHTSTRRQEDFSMEIYNLTSEIKRLDYYNKKQLRTLQLKVDEMRKNNKVLSHKIKKLVCGNMFVSCCVCMVLTS